MKKFKRLEFTRFRKDKDDPQQFPVFKSGSKVVYEVRPDAPTNEQAIIAEWVMIQRIEQSRDWANSVQTTLDGRKDKLMQTLMELKVKETEK